jgi:tetratricopeptide (TPR) repeat protein
MAKQKRLNKNLVAFLTIMGMLLVVSVFALIVSQQAARDPELLAQGAQEREQAGDLEEAYRRYLRAYGASDRQNIDYVLGAARCLYAMGELGAWRGELGKAHSEDPTDPKLIRALLEGMWRAQQLAGNWTQLIWTDVWQEFGTKLANLDPQSGLALASQAWGLWRSRDETLADEGDAAAHRALEVAPEDPRVVFTYLELLRRNAQADVRALLGSGAARARIEARHGEMLAAARELVEPALDAAPGDALLLTAYVRYVEDPAERVTLLERGLEANPESAEIALAMAEARLDQLLKDPAAMPEEEREALRAKIDARCAEAIALDPAMYDAYALQAELGLLTWGPDGTRRPPTTEEYRAALARFESACEQTLMLRSMRARLASQQRLRLVRAAFNASRGFYLLSRERDEPAEAEAGLALAQGFLDDAQTKYPNDAITDFMEGEYLDAIGETSGAITALERAHEKITSDNEGYWQAYRVQTLPSERLALLYLAEGQVGEAKRYAEECRAQYARMGRRPSAQFIQAYAQVLIELDDEAGARAALDVIDDYLRGLPEDHPARKALTPIRVVALTELGRDVDAEETFGGDDPRAKLQRARLLATQEDYAAAEALLQEVFTGDGASVEQRRRALRALVGVAERADRRAGALAFVRAQLDSPPEGTARLLRSYEVLLSEDDPEVRFEKLSALIDENPDPFERAREYFSHWATRDLGRALPYLEQMRTLRPDDMEILEREFRVRLELGQIDAAAALVPALTQANDGLGFDRAGGAVYRGELALARGEAETALDEFRAAVQALPRSDGMQIRLARAYLQAGRVEEATAALEQAVEINPRSFTANRLLMLLYEQRAAQLGPQQETYQQRAEQYFERAAALNPAHPDIRERRQRVAEDADPVAAIERRLALVAENPEDSENLLRIGQLYLKALPLARERGPAAVDDLVGEVEAFLGDAIPHAGDQKITLAAYGAQFFANAEAVARGEKFLDDLCATLDTEDKIRAELVRARYYEVLGDVESSERAYQTAQRLVGDLDLPETQRKRVDLRVALDFIDFCNRQQRPDKVIDACRWLLDRASDAADAELELKRVRLSLVEALLQRGLLDDAALEIKTYRDQYGADDLPGLISAVQVDLARRQRDAAAEKLTKILQLDPQNVWARVTRGGLALDRWRYDQALEDLRIGKELIASEPQLELRLRANLVALYEGMGQTSQAIRELRELLALLEARGARDEALQQTVSQMVLNYRRDDRFDQAQRLVSEYMERYPESPIWPLQLGALLELRAERDLESNREDAAKDDYALAATYFRQAAEKSLPNAPQFLMRSIAGRMRALVGADRAREAIAEFQRLPMDKPDPLIRAEVARAYESIGEQQQAADEWRRTLVEASQRSLGQLGAIAADLHQTESAEIALDYLAAAAEDVPADSLPNARLRAIRATHLLYIDRPEAALELINEVLDDVDPSTPEHVTVMLVRAQAQEGAGQMADALQSYRDILNLYPDEVRALNNLAYLLATADPPLRALEEAYQLAERLRQYVAGAESAPTLLDTIGWVYYQKGLYDMAVGALEEGYRLAPDMLGIRLHLGQAYHKAGRTSDARSVLSGGLELARSQEDAEMIDEFEEALKQL